MKKKTILLLTIFVISFFVFIKKDFRDFLTDSGLFIWMFIKNPGTVGAIFPSSKKLAKKITAKVNVGDSPVRVLEVGAGTGVFTEELVSKLGEKDHLDVVELDSEFCNNLDKKFGKKKNVDVHCVSILEWNPGYSYDYIVSGLPFNAFDADFLNVILNKYKSLIKASGIISYFEYIALAKIKLFFLRGKDKEEYSRTITTTADFRSNFSEERESVWVNLPPAYVYHLSNV